LSLGLEGDESFPVAKLKIGFFVTNSMTTLPSKTDESGKEIIPTWQGVAESGNILPIPLINITFF
jgi:hypothetical protein